MSDWISVEENLPKVSVEVLSYDEDGFYEIVFRTVSGNWSDGYSSCNVTHWMHLPEPPQ